MKAIFVGCVLFSKHLLETILNNSNIELVGLITKEKSTFNNDHFDLSKVIKSNNIPYKYVKDINDIEVRNWITNLNPKLIFCFGWPSLLKKNILKIPKYGVIGYHPSKLPQNRGRHPIIWALVLGLKETGSTFFLMDEGADSGAIIHQVNVKINLKDDASSLYKRLIEISKNQLTEIIENSSDLKLIKQTKSNSGNFWRKRGKKDGLIDWRMNAVNIYNLVRGLTRPYVGAHFEYDGNEIRVWKCKIIKNPNLNIEPGKILKVNKKGYIIVKVGIDSIQLLDFDPFQIKTSYLI